jgi:hypothetical protein
MELLCTINEVFSPSDTKYINRTCRVKKENLMTQKGAVFKYKKKKSFLFCHNMKYKNIRRNTVKTIICLRWFFNDAVISIETI